MKSISCTLIEDPSGFSSLGAGWDTLLSESGLQAPAWSQDWLLTWWEQFSRVQRRKLTVIAFYQGRELVACAPFSLRRTYHRRIVPIRRLDALASGEPLRDGICSSDLGLACHPAYLDTVVEMLAQQLARNTTLNWDELTIPLMDGSKPLPEKLAASLRRHGLHVSVAEESLCWSANLPADWDAYLEQLSRSTRRQARRTIRNFEEWSAGEQSIERAATLDRLDEGFAVLEDLHNRRWQSDNRSEGAFVSRRFSDFHRQLLTKLLPKGQAELLWLTAKGRPVAALYHLYVGKTVYVYQSGRAMDLPQKVCPGIALTLYAIQESIERGFKCYDWMVGDYRYKRQFGDTKRSLVRLSVRRPSLTGTACQTVDRAAACAKWLLNRGRATTPSTTSEDA